MVPGVGNTKGGARIWVSIGPVNFQPGEFAKIALALFFASDVLLVFAGRTAIRRYGCGSCHEIRGVPGAVGNVGPPLTRVADRTYIEPVTPEYVAMIIERV